MILSSTSNGARPTEVTEAGYDGFTGPGLLPADTHSMAHRDDPRSLALNGLQPLVKLVLAMLGALVAHQIAYPLVAATGFDTSANGEHSHISLQWALVTPFAALGATAIIVRQIRHLGFAAITSVGRLAPMIGGAFLIQEFVENRFSGGNGIEILANPAVLLGVALTPLVAWLLLRLLDDVIELITRWLSPSDDHPPGRPGLVPIPVRWSDSDRGSRSRPRAPPRRR